MNSEKKKGEITMFELLGNETEHDAAIKRTINLQQEIMLNLERICNCYMEIKRLEEENESINRALEHWKEELENYYSTFPRERKENQYSTQKNKHNEEEEYGINHIN